MTPIPGTVIQETGLHKISCIQAAALIRMKMSGECLCRGCKDGGGLYGCRAFEERLYEAISVQNQLNSLTFKNMQNNASFSKTELLLLLELYRVYLKKYVLIFISIIGWVCKI